VRKKISATKGDSWNIHRADGVSALGKRTLLSSHTCRGDIMRKNQIEKTRVRALMRWLPLLTLLVAMLALSGCVVRPVVADEAGPLLPEVVTGPVIAIAPMEAASGTEVTVAGAGWRPGEIVYVNLEGKRGEENLEAPVLVFTVDEEGRFYGAFVAPLDIFWQDATDLAVVARSLETEATVAVAFAFSAGGSTPTPTAALTTTAPTAPIAPTAPTATPTPASSMAPVNMARVVSAGLNLRSGPGNRYPVITSLRRGAELLVLGQSADAYWLYVQTPPALLGWVARPYTDFRGTAPVAPAPPLPTVWPTSPPPPPPPTPSYPTWNGAYFANPSLAGYPVLVRNDPAIDFNWGASAPAPGLPASFFSVRWTRAIFFNEGTYRFVINADDGVRFWIDGRLVLDAWAPAAGQPFVVDRFLGAGSHYLQVDYYGGPTPNSIRVTWDYLQPAPPPGFPDWRGEYFPNRFLNGAPLVVRNDRAIDFDWSFRSPAPGIGTEEYSVRWTRRIDFASGTYRFSTRSDDGIRVFIDGDRIIDEWRDMSGNTTYSAERHLSGHHEVRVEYYQNRGPAFVYFWWEQVHSPTPTNTPRPPTPTPTRSLFATANPSSGPVGSQITVNLGGFPGNTAVNLYIGGYVSARAANAAVYASTVTDRNGNGAMAFTLPTTWPDGREIAPGKLALLAATSDFGISASADFDVTAPRPTVAPAPYLDVDPSSGGPGTQVRAQGGGFPANTNVNIFLSSLAREGRSSQPAPIASARSDGNGNFTALFAMPRDFPNGGGIPTGKLVVLAATDNFATEASATFDFFVTPANATIRLQPNSGPPGTQVNVQGAGFPARTNVAVYLAPLDTTVGDGNPVRYAAGVTDGNGRYSLTFGFPTFWIDGSPIAQERIVVTVATDDFAVSASAAFRNTAPAPPWTPTPIAAATNTPAPTAVVRTPYVTVSPEVGGPGVLATLTGGDFPANTLVQVHLSSLARDRQGQEAYNGYANTVTDGAGRFLVAFPLPANWPDGRAIVTGPLLITAATEDFGAQASVTISYQGGREEVKPTAEPTPEPPTNTPEPPTATVEPPTATPEPPTNTPEAPTATAEPPTSTPEPPTATEEPTPEPEPPAAEPPAAPRPTDPPPEG
jgi:hypothetical protein